METIRTRDWDCSAVIRLICLFLMLGMSWEVGADTATVIPSIEKLINEKVQSLAAGELFYGCIFSIEYGDEDLFTRKSKIESVRIGKPGAYAELSVFQEFHKDDSDAPQISDCFAFTTTYGLGFPTNTSDLRYGYGIGKVVSGNFVPDESVVEKSLKDEITVNEYLSEGIAYGSTKRIILVGKVEKMYVAGDGNLAMEFVSEKGEILYAYYDKLEWSANDRIKDKIRSIELGSTIKVKGYFLMESVVSIFQIQKLLD